MSKDMSMKHNNEDETTGGIMYPENELIRSQEIAKLPSAFKILQEEDKTKHDASEFLDYLAAQTELAQHADDPLDTPLDVKVQAFTIERLRRYLALAHDDMSQDELVNTILAEWLYGMGE